MSAPESKSVASVLEKPGKSSRSSVSREQTPGFNFEGFLLEFADALNTTLDLDALLQRIAELVRRVINYEIFAILLLNERTQEIRMRFQIGHSPEAERLRVKVGKGITGRAVQERASVLVDDVTQDTNYINVNPAVCSELAVPLITKNRVIGVIDLQARAIGYFTE